MLIKYQNRRIYDTEQARYVGVSEIAARVVSGESVLEHRSKRDDSVRALLRILTLDPPPADMLRGFIRTWWASKKGIETEPQGECHAATIKTG